MESRNGGSRTRVSATERRARAVALDALSASTLASMDEIARRLPLGRDIADRLLTDSDARPAWRSLLQQNVTADAIPDDLRMRHWGLDERDVEVQRRACVALFAGTVIEFSLPRLADRQQDWKQRAAPYLEVVVACGRALEEPPLPCPEDAAALRRTVSFFENRIAFLKEYRAGPYIVGDRSNERCEGRYRSFDVRVRALAALTWSIYEQPLDVVIARIANVALGLGNRITAKTVQNWAAQGVPISRPAS